MIHDTLAPWNYGAGSGSIPLEARGFWAEMPRSISFPWTEWTRQRPPSTHGEFYVQVKAGANKSEKRWTETPLLLSQAGQCRLLQIVCVDEDGNPAPIPFHVSIYKTDGLGVPFSAPDNYSPFAPNHFRETDPVTGQPWPGTLSTHQTQ